MNAVLDTKSRYVSEFERLRPSLPGGAPWLTVLRETALARFGEAGFPTPRLEDWRYTNVAPIEKRHFTVSGELSPVLNDEQLRGLSLDGLDCHYLIFINGRLQPGYSTAAPLPKGVKAGSLARALAEAADELEPWLGRIADADANGFVALNTAFMNDGACIRVAPGVTVDKPVHLVFAVTGADGVLIAPRNLIVAGDNSRVTVIEHYVDLGGGAYLTTAVTEIAAGAGARVEHYKLQQEAMNAYHVATIQVRQDRNSRFVSRNFSLGGRLARNDINTLLGAGGAECVMDGLFMAGGRQHVDNHTFIDHAQPACSSREHYKGVLDGRSRGVFNGRIMVRQDAQQTDAHQSNHNLLLSEGAEVDTKPQLEIFADDVRCSHGATVGQLDGNALFYLRSRGLEERRARGLLTYAFVREVIDRIEVAPLRAAMGRNLLAWLPGVDESVSEGL